MIGIATKFAPLPEAFTVAEQAGFRRAELWTDAAVLGRWQEVVELARRHPFDYAVHFPTRSDQAPETLDQVVALCRALDARALILHQPHMDRHGQALLDRAPELPLAVENHKLSADAFERWARENPGLTLDVEHLWEFTLPDGALSDLLAFVRNFLSRFSSKLRHVHLPGYLPGQPEHRPMYCSRDLVLGVFSLLEEVHFEGLIVSEVNIEFQNIHDLQMDVLLFERWRVLQAG